MSVIFVDNISLISEVEVNLQPTANRPVCLGVGLSSGAYDQIFVFHMTVVGFLMWGAIVDKKMGLKCTPTIASGL
jgi:hypothetical protein